MSLTVTLTNRMTGEPVAYRAIEINIMRSDQLNVITDENGQFTIDEKYRNIQFILEPKYIEQGETFTDLHLGGWQNWESDTLNIPVMLSSGVEPRSLGAGITVALKISAHVMINIGRDDHPRHGQPESHWRVNIPNPQEIEIELSSPDPNLNVTTDHEGLFLIDEQYRNFECIVTEPRNVQSGWVRLDNNYIEMKLDIIPTAWFDRR